mmetsp:Transcript_54394/g.74354  ORF Transcript_54394/g.74354 Transcript_54394/m.74354 type:complete len:95 (-) Transcript_54394:129-413(-)
MLLFNHGAELRLVLESPVREHTHVYSVRNARWMLRYKRATCYRGFLPVQNTRETPNMHATLSPDGQEVSEWVKEEDPKEEGGARSVYPFYGHWR